MHSTSELDGPAVAGEGAAVQDHDGLAGWECERPDLVRCRHPGVEGLGDVTVRGYGAFRPGAVGGQAVEASVAWSAVGAEPGQDKLAAEAVALDVLGARCSTRVSWLDQRASLFTQISTRRMCTSSPFSSRQRA